jgi:hypothetical protein
MRKFLPLSLLSLVFLLPACGDNKPDTAKQQAAVRSAQTAVLHATSKNDAKAYCALTFNPRQNAKAWQAACVKRGISAKAAKQADKQIAAVKTAKVVVQDSQATIFMPAVGPQQYQLVGGKWLLNIAPGYNQSLTQQQTTIIRDRTRFYLATLINKDAAAYCVVGAKQGENQKACVARAKAWFKDKKSDYPKQVELAKQQLKSIDQAKVSIDGTKATVETDPESIKLAASGPGHSWIVVR